VSLPLLFVVCARAMVGRCACAYVLNPLSGTSAPAVATQVAGEHTTTLASACRIPLWLLLGGGRHASMRRRGPGRRKPRTRSSIGGWARAVVRSRPSFSFPPPSKPRYDDGRRGSCSWARRGGRAARLPRARSRAARGACALAPAASCKEDTYHSRTLSHTTNTRLRLRRCAQARSRITRGFSALSSPSCSPPCF